MPERLLEEASAGKKIDFKCPGSKYIRQPIPEIFICSDCEEEVEINEQVLKIPISSIALF